MSGGGSSLDRRELGESSSSGSELDGGGSLELRVGDNGGLDDVDSLRPGGVSAGHLVVELADSANERVSSELLVHVDVTLPGLVSQDDAVVLDGVGLSLKDLRHGHDLSLSSPDLVLPLHLVPEL